MLAFCWGEEQPAVGRRRYMNICRQAFGRRCDKISRKRTICKRKKEYTLYYMHRGKTQQKTQQKQPTKGRITTKNNPQKTTLQFRFKRRLNPERTLRHRKKLKKDGGKLSQ